MASDSKGKGKGPKAEPGDETEPKRTKGSAKAAKADEAVTEPDVAAEDTAGPAEPAARKTAPKAAKKAAAATPEGEEPEPASQKEAAPHKEATPKKEAAPKKEAPKPDTDAEKEVVAARTGSASKEAAPKPEAAQQEEAAPKKEAPKPATNAEKEIVAARMGSASKEAAPKPATAQQEVVSARTGAAARADGKGAGHASAGAELHLVTGFPGFIGRRLLRKLGTELQEARFALLVQPHLVDVAKTAVEEAIEAVPSLRGRVEVLPGDITEPGLGIETARLERLLDEITAIWHLAAVYDLAVGRAVAYRVNVVGTANVLDLCERLRRFERLNYVSTCYVSGDREGLILETELDEGQGHKNHYESTKFWAEIEVQRRWDKIPATIYRPGIVVGDSRTGETDKYDGPYYFIRFLQRLPEWLPMVNIGAGEALVNLVPVDYLVDSMVAISRNPDAAGKVVQLADPNPMRARDLVGLIMKVMGRRPPVGVVPSAWFDRLMRVRRVRRMLGMPREVLAYFNHQARFDVTQALDLLAGSGVRCPHISTYVRTLVDYVRRNPNKAFLDQRAL